MERRAKYEKLTSKPSVEGAVRLRIRAGKPLSVLVLAEQRFDSSADFVVLQVADDNLTQPAVPIEEELRRPRIGAVGLPEVEVVINRDGPDDALSRQALLDVGRPRSAGVSGA